MSASLVATFIVNAIATIFYIMLLAGSSLQTDGWLRYSPNGTFVTLKLPPYEQRILTQCSLPTAHSNASYPTVRHTHPPPRSIRALTPYYLRYGWRQAAEATAWQTFGPSATRSTAKASKCARTICPE
jgi:hypothetical protein